MKKYLVLFLILITVLCAFSAEPVKIRLVYNGNNCEAPIFVAYEKGFFKDAGINVEIVKGDYNVSKEGIALGKVDAAAGLILQWLKPVEAGLDIKFVLGVHTGCISIVTLKDSPVKSIDDLKGKVIGVSGGIGAGAMNFGFRVLNKYKIKPQTEAEWRDYPAPQLITALEKGEISAAITSDTLAFGWINEGKAKPLLIMATDENFKNEICCVTGIRGGFIKDHPKESVKFTKTILKAAKWIQANKAETAKIITEKKYVPGTAEFQLQLLNAYDFNASVKRGEDALTEAVNEFKRVDLFDKNLDTQKVVSRIYVKLKGVE
jgi:NitT/TauT family transport system substrate-binding protein